MGDQRSYAHAPVEIMSRLAEWIGGAAETIQYLAERQQIDVPDLFGIASTYVNLIYTTFQAHGRHAFKSLAVIDHYIALRPYIERNVEDAFDAYSPDNDMETAAINAMRAAYNEGTDDLKDNERFLLRHYGTNMKAERKSTTYAEDQAIIREAAARLTDAIHGEWEPEMIEVPTPEGGTQKIETQNSANLREIVAMRPQLIKLGFVKSPVLH